MGAVGHAFEGERIHDVTTTVEGEIPYSATRVVVLYKLNDAFSAADGVDAPGFGARFDVRVTQALPFMNFRTSQWEMLVGVRNLFHDSLEQRLHLRRAARRPAAQTPRRRSHRQVLASGRRSPYETHSVFASQTAYWKLDQSTEPLDSWAPRDNRRQRKSF